MKCRNKFWISLVCGITLACSPVLAQSPQQDALPPLPNGQQAGARPGLPPPVLSPDQRNAQRTIPGAYRLTYTLAEMDGTKRVGSQRYAIVLDSGEEVPSAQLKLGSKVPLETGELQGSSTSQTISYIDVGLSIDASLRSFANGYELRSHIVQSAIDISPPPPLPPLPPPSQQSLPPLPQQPLPKDPVIRETNLKSAVLLQENKPVIIGNVDMLGSTHVLQIQVELTKVP